MQMRRALPTAKEAKTTNMGKSEQSAQSTHAQSPPQKKNSWKSALEAIPEKLEVGPVLDSALSNPPVAKFSQIPKNQSKKLGKKPKQKDPLHQWMVDHSNGTVRERSWASRVIRTGHISPLKNVTEHKYKTQFGRMLLGTLQMESEVGGVSRLPACTC